MGESHHLKRWQLLFCPAKWKYPVSGNDIIWQRGMEKHLVETGHTRSVISFCEECWKAVVSISHHCHISCPSKMGFFKESDNICERKISAGRLIVEVFVCSQSFGPQDIFLWALIWRKVELVCPQIICSRGLRSGVSGSQPPPPWLFCTDTPCWMRTRKPGNCSRNWCTTNQQGWSCCIGCDESVTISSELSIVCQICMFHCKVFSSPNIQYFFEVDSEKGHLQGPLQSS